jgi:hypothetical protein
VLTALLNRTASVDHNSALGSKPEKLCASICFPLFIQ